MAYRQQALAAPPAGTARIVAPSSVDCPAPKAIPRATLLARICSLEGQLRTVSVCQLCGDASHLAPFCPRYVVEHAPDVDEAPATPPRTPESEEDPPVASPSPVEEPVEEPMPVPPTIRVRPVPAVVIGGRRPRPLQPSSGERPRAAARFRPKRAAAAAASRTRARSHKTKRSARFPRAGENPYDVPKADSDSDLD